ncbi:T9SS type A sorting domain-containing protein [Flavobacterium sp.]
MKNIYLLLFTLLSSSIFSQSYSGPESVEYDFANNRWLIANTSSHQVLARNSAGVLSVFASGLVSGPYGIEIVGEVLYCCSGSSIKGYNLSDGANVFNLDVGGSFLNGLTHDNSGNLFVTDFSAKKIIKINIATQTFTTIATSLSQSPNGIIFNEATNSCVFVNWGSNAPIKSVNLDTNVVTTLLSTTLSNCDGIAKDASGNYYISNWGMQNVVKYNSNFSNTAEIVTSGLSNPADIFINTIDNVLGIPNSGNNTVTFFTLPSLSAPSFDNSILNSVIIYPNPITELSVLKVELPKEMKVMAKIIDIQGRIIADLISKDTVLQNGSIQMNTNSLNSGIYFVVFSANEISKTLSFIVK